MADIFNFTDTWNSGGTTFNAIKVVVTDTASAADSMLMNLLVGSTSMFSVSKTGKVNADGIDLIGGTPVSTQIKANYVRGDGFVQGQAFYVTSTNVYFDAPAAGVLKISDVNQNDLVRINLGANTSGYPAIARDGAGLMHICADGTTGTFISGVEQTAPSAPAANGYRIYAQDNGGGKTQLMVIFSSGAAQQIAIQP